MKPSRSAGSSVKRITQIGQKAPLAPAAIQTPTQISDKVTEPPASCTKRRRSFDLRSTSASWAASGADGQVGAQRIEVGASTRGVDGLQALLVLLGGEPSGDRVLVQLLDKPLTLRVGYAYLARLWHTQNVDQADRYGANVVPRGTISLLA